MSVSSQSLQPSFTGHVANTDDALKLFEACITGTLPHVARRPHGRECGQLIRSGCVFIYAENASGIKRWTDGVPWSPSRILGNFLVYRELLKSFPPGEKKRATKRNKRRTKPGEPYPRNDSITSDGSTTLLPMTPSTLSFGQEAGGVERSLLDHDKERSLIGSLVDSYGFKEDGLVKKTMSVTVQGVHHHLISYYKVKDVITKALWTPSEDPMLRQLRPRAELTLRQNFRAPVDDAQRAAYPSGDRGSYNGCPPILNSQMYQLQLPQGNNGYYHSMEAIAYSAGHQPPLQDSYYPAQQVAPQSHIKQGDYYALNPSYPAYHEQMNSNIAPVGFSPDGQINQLPPMTYPHAH